MVLAVVLAVVGMAVVAVGKDAGYTTLYFAMYVVHLEVVREHVRDELRLTAPRLIYERPDWPVDQTRYQRLVFALSPVALDVTPRRTPHLQARV